MGWKLFHVFVVHSQGEKLGEPVKSSVEFAQEWVSRLGYRTLEPLTIAEAAQLSIRECLTVTKFSNGTMFSLEKLAHEFFYGFEPRPSDHEVFKRIFRHYTRNAIGENAQTILDHFQDSRILVGFMDSVIDQYGYALYENGNLKRMTMTCRDFRQFINRGNPASEEANLYKHSYVQDGREMVAWINRKGVIEYLEEWQLADELVFRMVGSIASSRPDEGGSSYLDSEKTHYFMP